MFKGIFLDLDGTLVDTHQSNCEAYLHAIDDVIGPRKVERAALLERIRNGKGHVTFLRELVIGITDEGIRRVARRKAEVYPSFLGCSRLNENLVRDVLKMREESGAVVVLVTTAKEMNARNVLWHHGIESLFDHMIFGDGITNQKPDPEIYLKALEITGLDHEEVIAYEDSSVGIESASRAGIRVVKVDWHAA